MPDIWKGGELEQGQTSRPLYMINGRWFDPNQNRFLSAGPVTAKSPNPYTLNGNNPVNSAGSIDWSQVQGPNAFGVISGFGYGVWDALTFGHLDNLIGTVGAKEEAMQTRVYWAGMAVGVAAQIAVGNYAAGVNLATAGRAAYVGVRGFQTYSAVGDVVGVYDSYQSLRSGEFNPMALLGFAPTIGWGTAAWSKLSRQSIAGRFSPDGFGRLYEEGFINAFVSGKMSHADLEKLKVIVENSPEMMRKGKPVQMFLDEAEDGFHSTLHQVYLNAKDGGFRGTLAEELQHAIDNAAGMYTDARLKGSVPALRAQFGKDIGNVVWHESTFRRIADTVDRGSGSILNLFLESHEAAHFRQAADVLKQALADIGITL